MAFDFGDGVDFRRCVDLFIEMVRNRYNRARPSTPAFGRLNFGVLSMLYRLAPCKPKVAVVTLVPIIQAPRANFLATRRLQ